MKKKNIHKVRKLWRIQVQTVKTLTVGVLTHLGEKETVWTGSKKSLGERKENKNRREERQSSPE